MAKANRYTQLTPARYTPLSLEEIMMVPLLKRKQHDELLNGIAETRSGLASMDYDDMYSEAAQAEKSRLEQMLEAQAEEAASRGISGSLRSSFIDLNAQYQNSVGPKGTLGSIEAASKSIEEARNKSLALAGELGHDIGATGLNYEDELNKYKEEYTKTGKVKKMNPLLPPNYENLEEDIYRFKGVNTNIETSKGSQTYSVDYDYDLGAYVIETQDGTRLTETNDAQIDSLLEFMNVKYGTKGASGYESLKFNRQDPKVAAQMINALVGTARSKKVQDNIQTKFQFLSTNTDENGNVDPDKENNNVLYEDIQETAETDYSTRSYEANEKLIAELRATPQNDPNYQANIARARKLGHFHAMAETGFLNDSVYQNHQQALETYIGELPPMIQELAPGIADGSIKVRMDQDVDESIHQQPGAMWVTHNGESIKVPIEKEDYIKLTESVGTIQSLRNDMKKLRNSFVERQTVDYVGYVVDRTADTSAKWGEHERQITDLISSAGQVGNDYEIESFYTSSVDSGAKISPTGLDQSQMMAINKGLFGALGASGNAKIVRQYLEGETNKPMIEFSFTPNEDIEIDGSTGLGSHDYELKKGTQVVMRVALSKFDGEDATAVQNLYLTSLEKYGGKKGVFLAESMRNSARFAHIEASVNADDYTQSDAIKQVASYFNRFHTPVNLIKTIPRTNPDQPASRDARFAESNRATFMFTAPNGDSDEPIKWGDVLVADDLTSETPRSGVTDRMLGMFVDFFIANNPYGLTTERITKAVGPEADRIDSLFVEFLEKYGNIPMEFVSKEQALLTFKQD